MSEEATLDDFTETGEEAESEEDGEQELFGLGEIPADWSIKPLADIAEIIPGNSPPSSTYNEKGEGLPFFQGNSEFGHFHPEADTWCSDPRKEAEENDVLMSIRAPVGDLNIADKNCCIGRGLAALRPKTLNGLYLFYNLAERKPWLSRLATGSTFKSVTKSDLQLLDVPVPPLEEQRKIVTVLHNVDQAIQKTKEIIDQTRRVKKGLHQSLFRNWSGATVSDPLAGKYPEEWELMELSEVVDVTDAEHFTPDYTNSGVPVLRPGDLSPGRISLDNVEKRVDEETYNELTRRYTPSNKDIVYSRSQNFAVASQVIEDRRYCLGQDTVVIESNELNSTFLLHLLNSPVIKNQAIRRSTGSTFSRVNLGDIRSFKIPIPSEEVQQQIAKRMSEIEERLRVENDYQTRLSRLKRGLMQDLLSGTVRTTDTNIEVPEEVAQYG